MAESKKKNGELSETKNNYKFVIRNIIFLIFGLLCFISCLPSFANVKNDYLIISSANLGFSDIITLKFPEVSNPIGIFGAVISYNFMYFFGKLLALSICISLMIFSVFELIFKEENFIKIKTITFILASYFLSVLFWNTEKFRILTDGFFIYKSFNIFSKIFNHTGTNIITGTLLFFSVLIIFEVENIKKLLMSLLNFAGKLFYPVYKIFRYENIKKLFSKKEKSEKYLSKSDIIKENALDDYEPEDCNLQINHSSLPSEKEVEKNENSYSVNKDKMSEQEESLLPDDNCDFREFEEDVPNIKTYEEGNFDAPVSKEKEIRKLLPRKIVGKSENQAEFEEYTVPDIDDFLSAPVKINNTDKAELENEIKKTGSLIKAKLQEFSIEASVINVNIGPIITRYELKPAPGISVKKFSYLADDMALALKAKSLRVQAPIPGKGLVGIELPNKNRDIIYLKDILQSQEMSDSKTKLGIGLGKDISGTPVVADLTKMPHLLIAGATGSGKSVCINTMINSLLLFKKPEDVRLVMIDPKRIELSGYEGIPHMIQDVVTDPDDALFALNWAVSEMERRYELLQKYKVRDIISYNKKIEEIDKIGENPYKLTEYEEKDIKLPYIVIIVDEFADLIMTAGKDIELPITRLAQMARAIGIHLILATQRPSSKVITGVIKANFPARIAFQVSSKIDSRVILDMNGAEQLLGKGDMLFLPPGKAVPERVHGAYMSDDEIENLVKYLVKQPKPDLQIEIITEKTENLETFNYDDDLFPEAARMVVSSEMASVSMLQRHFKIGYARAGRLIDLLEKASVVGPHQGSKSRDVLVTLEDLEKHGF